MHCSMMRTAVAATKCHYQGEACPPPPPRQTEGSAKPPPPKMQTPTLDADPPLSCDLWCMLGSQSPRGQNDWQTLLKTLPSLALAVGNKGNKRKEVVGRNANFELLVIWGKLEWAKRIWPLLDTIQWVSDKSPFSLRNHWLLCSNQTQVHLSATLYHPQLHHSHRVEALVITDFSAVIRPRFTAQQLFIIRSFIMVTVSKPW